MTSIRAVQHPGVTMPGRIGSALPNPPTSDGGFAAILSARSAAGRAPQASVRSEVGALARANEGIEDSDAVSAESGDAEEVRKAFQSFVGQTLFGMMLKEMRKSVHKTPYFHGGAAEDIFQQQLDTVLSEKLADATGDRLAKPMYELFQLRTKGR